MDFANSNARGGKRKGSVQAKIASSILFAPLVRTGTLRADDNITMIVSLEGGVRYRIAGQCDNDCSDLDLQVSRDGRKIVEDLEVDDVPVVTLTPPTDGNYDVKVPLGKVAFDAMQEIMLKVGGSSVKIDQMGVTIKGMMVKIEGTVMLEAKGLMTKVNGDAMLMIKGGIVMIN